MKGSLCRLAETSFLWRDTAMRIRERFNPHAPFEARRRSLLQRSSCWANFNPRAPCGARPVAPRRRACGRYFNPRAPWESLRQVFQPTRPLRGATRGRATAAPDLCYFNPRAPCGARRMGTFCELDAEIFQPTRPLRGATAETHYLITETGNFNPRAPCGARRHRTSFVLQYG